MKRNGRATIRDVAAFAGVSLTTVSDALSGKGRLPDATRDKVLEAAQQLNYRPNAIARGLRSQSLGLVGIVIAPAEAATLSSVWYWASIATHMSEAILANGFAPVLLPHNAATLTKLPIPLDGALLVDPLDDDEVLAYFRSENVRTVTIGRDIRNPQGPWVDEDNEAGVAELLRLTVKPGETVAVVTLSARKSYVVDGLRGAERWAHSVGSKLVEYRCKSFDDAEVDQALLQVRQERAKVILAQNDRLASKLLARLKAAGAEVPGDVRLISATDAPDLQHTEPSITSLKQHPERLSEIAARTLFDVLHGVPTQERQLVPMEIAFRRSAPAVGDG
jgi:DNA-binding LacI/PurR family transcriptional regulator